MMVGIRMFGPQQVRGSIAKAYCIRCKRSCRSVARCKHEMHRELQPAQASKSHEAINDLHPEDP